MSHRPTQKEKTQRAFRGYLDLIDTAEWMLGRMRGQLESFDLTMGFRLLEMLYREGAGKRSCRRREARVPAPEYGRHLEIFLGDHARGCGRGGLKPGS
jgi:hypothetical protein